MKWWRHYAIIATLAVLMALPRFAHHTPDSKHYVNLALYFRGELERDNLVTPYAYRVLLPFVVSLVPFDNVDLIFAIIGVLCSILAYAVFFHYVAYMLPAPKQVNTALLLLLFSFPSLNYTSAVLTDAAAFLAFVTTAYLLLTERHMTFAAVVALGILIRETMASMILIYLLYQFTSQPRPRLLSLALVLTPSLLALLIPRLAFADLPHYLWIPSAATVLANLTRSVSWVTTLATLGPPLLLLLLGVAYSGSEALSEIPKIHVRFLLSTAVGSSLVAFYGFLAAFMSGRFVWPMYIVLIPVAVMIAGDIPIISRYLAPIASMIFSGRLADVDPLTPQQEESS